MSHWLRRHDVGCFYLVLYAVLLAFFEYVLIHRFILNAPSEDLDLIVVAGFAAPLAAGVSVVAFIAVGLLICMVSPRKKEKKGQ